MKQIEVKNVVEALLRQPLIKVNTLEPEKIPNNKGVYMSANTKELVLSKHTLEII